MKAQAVVTFLVGGAFALPGAANIDCAYDTSSSSAAPSSTSYSATSSSAPSSSAVPSSTSPVTPSATGVSEMCTNNDDDLWTRDHWNSDDRDMTEWYNDWYIDNIEGDAQIDETFAGYWGLGPSFSCDIDNECKAPQCSTMKRPGQEQDYEEASMFLASMVNFNHQYSRIYQALDGVKTDFAAIQAVLQQTFYPGITPSDMDAIQGMNGGLTAMGLLSAWAGPADPFVNTGKEIFGGVSRGLTAIMTASDRSIKHMSELASIFTEKIDEVRKTYAKIHDDVLKWGVTEFTTIDAIFEGGAYVDDREIAILHDIAVEDVRDYVRNMFFAMIINNVWLKQGAYIYSREMPESDCKDFEIERSDELPPFICYDDRIYFLNKYLGATTGKPPGITSIPGWKELEKEVGITIEDAMLSSIKAYNIGGHKYDASEYIDELFEGDIQEKVHEGPRMPGVFTFPVCEVQTSEEFSVTGLDGKTSDSSSWNKLDYNKPVGKHSSNGIQICMCAQTKDRNGVSIRKLPNPGPGSFRDLINDKGHSKCSLVYPL
ncbi:hypothetical protein BDW62DRAFT_209603 [Aspergillus aurantiobrunneus]